MSWGVRVAPTRSKAVSNVYRQVDCRRVADDAAAMTTPTTQQAEALWVTAHEHVRRGDFASATRDLAQCFALLQANNDPRLPEVHRRWTEVHQLAVEEAAQGKAVAAQPAQAAPSLEAEAEAAANAGNLEEAIGLYERALAQRPDNELVAERLIELKNARPRAAALTSSAPVGAIDEEALAASIDLADDLGDDSSNVVGGTLVVDAPVEHVEPVAERADPLDETMEFVPAAAMREDDFGDVVPAIVRAEAADRAGAPEPAILRDEAVERSIVVEPIADDDEPAFVPAIVRDEAVEHSIVVEPIVDDEPAAPAVTADAVAIAEQALSLTDDDVKETNIHDAVTLVPHRPESSNDEAPTKATANMYLEDVGAPSKITASMYLEDVPAWGAAAPEPAPAIEPDAIDAIEAAQVVVDEHNVVVDEVIAEEAASAIAIDDPRWGTTDDANVTNVTNVTDVAADVAEPVTAAIAIDDPRWGADEVVAEAAPEAAPEAISGDDPRWGAPSPAVEAISGDDPRWGAPSPAVEAISGDDPRWGAPSPAAEAITGDDPRWGAPSPAVEAISGDDPRWGGPATTAPLMAVADAPVGMPSLELDIDMGASVSGSEADELPVDADDLVMVGDDDIMAQSLLPQPALVADVLADGFPKDPEAMLNAVLERVRSNRRAA
jgi:tetratricopeptide (TPR) repeat protein